jgi:hypothetical protein
MFRTYALFAFVALLCLSDHICAQAVATAGSVGANATTNLQGNGGTTSVFGVEGPSLSGSNDCTDASRPGDHSDFGEHITHVAESDLPGASTVFLFHSHLAEDSDRCKNLDDIDRIRTEIKGGPQGRTDPELEHGYGTTSFYRWQFRLDASFVGTSSFSHLFQLKPVGGDDVTIPMVTLTARANDVEVIHIGDGTLAGDYRDGISTNLAEPSMANFRGKWVEVSVRVVHRNAADGGALDVRINDVATGAVITDVTETNIDMWRGATNGLVYINRPKWGIYRKLVTGVGQRDETVRFANFCSSEQGDICPSVLPSQPLDDFTKVYPFDGVENVPLTMPLVWDELENASSYEVYFGTNPSPGLVTTTTQTSYTPMMEYGQTYYYQIKALSNTDESLSEIKAFSTLDMADINGWDVARGHARPSIEDGGNFEFDNNTPLPISQDCPSVIAEEPGNSQYSFFSFPSGNFRWRYRFDNGNELTTVVIRLSKLPIRNNMIWVELKSLGFNQKISIKADNMKFERGLNGASSVTVDYPSILFDDNEFHILRFTFGTVDNFVAAPTLQTKVYIDEATTPFYTSISDVTNSSQFIDIGKSGGTNYGANIDFIAINPTGVFPPQAVGADLPSDLLQFAVLPLQWSGPLTVQLQGKYRQLNWAVANQVDSDYFTVETSTDGSAFLPLGRLTADGELAGEKTYTYTDQRNNNERTYYRVRQTDYDGSFSFSNLVIFEPSEDSERAIALTPNPTSSWLKLSNLPEGIHHFSVTNLTGQTVNQGFITQEAGQLDLHSLPAGAYLLRLRTKDGKPLSVKRFVKR